MNESPTREEEDPTLALADGMKSLLRFGDDRSAHLRLGYAGCQWLLVELGFILMNVDEVLPARN